MLMMILRREWKRAGSYESLYHLDAQLQDFSLLKGVVGRDRVLNSWISCIIFFSLLLFLRFFLEAFFLLSVLIFLFSHPRRICTVFFKQLCIFRMHDMGVYIRRKRRKEKGRGRYSSQGQTAQIEARRSR